MNPLTTFSLALGAAGVAADMPAQQSSLQDVQQLEADYALVQRLDGALWGLGRAYSTRFDAADPVFHPANRTVGLLLFSQFAVLDPNRAFAAFLALTAEAEARVGI
ncbi:MAG: hypothetical protein JNK15_01900 [Planctomycetes bacterium]|nr:hypothetical protein [Planctomycetota bacterium]